MKNLVILGSSGSIGKSALWVASRFPEELNVFGLAVNSNLETMAEQVEKFRPRVVCVVDPKSADKFAPVARQKNIELYSGYDGLEKLAGHPDTDIVLNSVVGFAGLRSTLAAARAGKRIALANKESMVAGGELVNKTVHEYHAEIIPVDSEHSAIFQCLKSGRAADIGQLILTSSGGPFRKLPIDEFGRITVEQALKHPTWNMGPKITIDSATLMNKGLEIIEAAYLFNIGHKNIKVVVHPQSIIHSMVEYCDGSIIAQMSRPDMRLPILYSYFYPERREMEIADLDFKPSLSLEFEEPDETKFPSLNLARQALERGGTAPAIFNAANEVAVEAFLKRLISFTEIFATVSYSLDHARIETSGDIDSIVSADKGARMLANEFIRTQSV